MLLPQRSRSAAAQVMQGKTRKMGVVGAGLIGRAIAFVYAMAGWDVVLVDRSREQLDKSLGILEEFVTKGVNRGLFGQQDAEAALGRLQPATELGLMGDVSFVVESVFEREPVKAEVLETLDQLCTESCIIATNTSKMPMSTFARHLSEPRRASFIGTYYLSPVPRMKLLEVIPACDTAEDTVAKTMQMCANGARCPFVSRM